MGEDDESFATTAAVPSFVASGSNARVDATQDVFVELFVKTYQDLIEPDTLHDVRTIENMLDALLGMKLNLPENAEARESISKTNIIECLTKTMAKAANIMAAQQHRPCSEVALHPMFSSATRLMGDLISGSHTENIKECHKCEAMPLLVKYLSCRDGHHCSHVLKLLRIDDDPQQTEEVFLNYSSVSTILVAMSGGPDLQEWGCSGLYYVLEGWDRHGPDEDAGEAFLKSGAIDAILTAIGQNPTGYAPAFGSNPAPGTVREASKCILILAKKSPDIRSTLLKKGVAVLLGAALQKQLQYDTTDIYGHCQQALLAVLGSPM